MAIITYKHGRKGKIIFEEPIGNQLKGAIAADAEIDLSANVYIGVETSVTDKVKIYTHKHNWKHSRGLRREIQTVDKKELRIGRDVFIANGATILCIDSIGDGAVVGAMSVVTKNIPPYEIWAGNPAQKIGERTDA
jgi:acetyltransferase-like isoleucine patch superfamily enzyme